MVKEFKEFLLRGNLVELEDLVTPLIAAIFGQPDFSGLTFTINESTFRYGEFSNAVITFLLIAAVLFFLVIKPVNALVKRARREGTPDPTTRQCPECLSEIPLDARRCAFCTTEVAAAV